MTAQLVAERLAERLAQLVAQLVAQRLEFPQNQTPRLEQTHEADHADPSADRSQRSLSRGRTPRRQSGAHRHCKLRCGRTPRHDNTPASATESGEADAPGICAAHLDAADIRWHSLVHRPSRSPQSAQSVPRAHSEPSEPGPPSSQTPLHRITTRSTEMRHGPEFAMHAGTYSETLSMKWHSLLHWPPALTAKQRATTRAKARGAATRCLHECMKRRGLRIWRRAPHI